MAAAVVLVACACGGGDDGEGGAAADASAIPDCAMAGKTVARPEKLPAGFPLPEGTVFTGVDSREAGAVVAGGVIPDDLAGAAAFFLDELPAAGYKLAEGDAEQDEAEAPFSGHGISGKWRVNGILGCPDAVTLFLVVNDLDAK